MEVLKISAKSNPNSVAGAITELVKENTKVEIQAIGAGAINQAVKSIAVARGYLAPIGIDLVCVPAFVEIKIDEISKTGIKFMCRGRPCVCL